MSRCKVCEGWRQRAVRKCNNLLADKCLTCMAVAALLDPELCHVEGLPPKPLCPKQVAVALEHAHHVVITDLLHASR